MNLLYFKRTLFLLLVAAGMAGCMNEYGAGDKPLPITAKALTITVNIPGQQMPSATRSIAGAAGEAAVNSIDILVFAGETIKQCVAGEIVSSQSNVALEEYKVTFRADLNLDPDARTLAIVANVPNIASLIGSKTTKKEILEALVSESAGTWKAGSGDYTPIPMYGEAPVASGIHPDMTIDDVDMIRMLARIDVVNNASGSFTLNNVYVVNRNTVGNIAPAWAPLTGVLLAETDQEYPYNKNHNPMLPTNPGKKTGFEESLTYAYNHNGGEGLLGEIYIFEANATSGKEGESGHTDAMCLIVEGVYDGSTYYYRIDFTDGKDGEDQEPDEVEYMPVYRNHLYRFEIGAVNGPGYANPGDALKSLGVLNNLKTTLHVMDQGGITDMVFNGQHYLGLGDAATLGYMSDCVTRVQCATNYAYGWQISHIEGGSGWLTAVKEGLPGDLKSTIKLTATSDHIGSGSLPADRVAYVHVKAGLLTHKLKVTQEGDFFSVTVSPSSLSLPGAGVSGGSDYNLTVACTDSKGNPVNLAWTLTSAAPAWFRMSTASDAIFATCATDGTVSGTGSQTIYVFATQNESTSSYRKTTINLNSTKMVDVTQELAFRNFPAYPGVIGYDPDQGDLNLEGRGVMVYFKYGSIIGMYSGDNDDDSAWKGNASIAFNPTSISNFSDYFSFPDKSAISGAGQYTTVGAVSISGDFLTVDNAVMGNGDPCRLVGMTSAQVKEALAGGELPDNNTWRLPTSEENLKLGFNSATAWHWSVPPQGGAAWYSHTFTGLNKGDEFTTTGWSALPAAGYRSFQTGAVEKQNVQGFCWSSTRVSEVNYINSSMLCYAAHLVTRNNGLPQSHGVTVRCVPQP